MKEFLKQILKCSLVALIVALLMLAVFVPTPAQAQTATVYSATYPAVTVTLTTNAIAASGVLTQSAVYVDARVYDEFALQSTSVLGLAGTAATTYTFQYSVDKVNWGSGFTWAPAATGATTNTVVTNITVGAVGWIKLFSIANGNTSTWSNVSLKVAPKPKRHGN